MNLSNLEFFFYKRKYLRLNYKENVLETLFERKRRPCVHFKSNRKIKIFFYLMSFKLINNFLNKENKSGW